MNLASVHGVPVVFLIENNHYAFSTPTQLQYHCQRLSDRAAGYGVGGRTIDDADAWSVYVSMCDALEAMQREPLPTILECMSMRLFGHAAYDKGSYVPADTMRRWRERDPLPSTRRKLLDLGGASDAAVDSLEAAVEEEIRAALAKALTVGRPEPRPACARRCLPEYRARA